MTFESITAGHDYLTENFPSLELNAKTTVRQYIARGDEPEVAYGIKDPAWKANHLELNKLLDEGYSLTGLLDPNSKPVIVHRDKEIFSSQKEFCNARDFDPSTCQKRLMRA